MFMKKVQRIAFAAVIFSIVFAQQSCLKDACRNTYTYYQPVYKTLSQVRVDMKGGAPQPLKNTGKLNVFGSYIFLNEKNKGIHVIDNSNPASPVNAGFINIPANIDLAVKGSYLYADSYSDIIVFDISNPTAAMPVTFLNNVMMEKDVYWNGLTSNPDSVQVVVDYLRKDTTVDCNTYAQITSCAACVTDLSKSSFYAAAATPVTGTGGSMAGFTIVNDYLYAVGSSSLYSLNISSPQRPQQTAVKNLGWGIETIYPFQNKLFIGSRTGMFIYDLSNPASPAQQGLFTYATRCDPVIADGQYAYVTLRSGTTCNGNTNELEVVDVSNLSAPKQKAQYNLAGPYGLAKDGDNLFVCDGKAGLKLYNAASPLSLQLVKEIGGMETYDVIAVNKLAIVVAKDGLYQFDYTNPAALKQLSKISLSN